MPAPSQKPAPSSHDRAEFAGWNAKGITMVSVYILTLLVVLLVIYLFYAVINPQKF
jgi:K+-transporting ATPase KdpF subunit